MSHLKTSGILRLTGDPTATGGATPECDGCDGAEATRRRQKDEAVRCSQPESATVQVRTWGATLRRSVSHPVAPKNLRISAAFRPKVRRLSATGATGATPRFAPRRSPKHQGFCGFQAQSATGVCELRTRIFRLSLAQYHRAPPRYQYSPRKDPDVLDEIVNLYSEFDLSFAGSSCYYQIIQRAIAALQETYLFQSERVPSAAKQPAWHRDGLSRIRSSSWLETTSCGGRLSTIYP